MVRTNEELNATLQQIAQDVGVSGDPNLVAEELLKAVVTHSPWSRCSAAIFDLASGRLIARFHYGFDPAVVATWADHLEEGSPTKDALKSNQILSIPDVNQAGKYASWTARYVGGGGYASSLYIPVSMRAGEGAVLSVHRPVAHVFSENELALATSIASFAAIAFRNMIARDRAVAAETIANEQLSQLNQIVMEQNATVTRQNESLQFLAAAHERLLEIQLQGTGVNALCHALHSLMDAPVVMLDRFHQLLDAAGFDDEAAELIAEKYAHDDSTSGNQLGPKPAFVTIAEQKLLVGVAMDGKTSLGALIVVDPDTDRSQLLTRVVELGCLHFALEVLNQRIAIEAEARSQHDFITALLTPGTGGLDLKRRAALLGIQFDSSNRVIRARATGNLPELSSRDSSELSATVKRHLTDAGIKAVVAPAGPTDFVLVLPAPGSAADGISAVTALIRRTLRDGLAALARTGSKDVLVQIGIGTPGQGAEALRASHAGALRALEVMGVVSIVGGDLRIDDAGSYSLLAAISSDDRHEFAERYLRQLIAYDKDHGSDLIETLAVYFEVVGYAQRVAEIMYLHVSTVRYRLNRIETLAGLSLRKSDERLCLELALKIAQMDGEVRLSQAPLVGAPDEAHADRARR